MLEIAYFHPTNETASPFGILWKTSCTHNSPTTHTVLFSGPMSSGGKKSDKTFGRNGARWVRPKLALLFWWGKPRAGWSWEATRGYFHRGSATRAPGAAGARIYVELSFSLALSHGTRSLQGPVKEDARASSGDRFLIHRRQFPIDDQIPRLLHGEIDVRACQWITSARYRRPDDATHCRSRHGNMANIKVAVRVRPISAR